jgi:hypothetical protein
MRHRTSLLSGLPLLLLCSALSAQEPPPPPPAQPQLQQQQQQHPVVRQRMEVLLRGITLTPEQQSKVDSILASNAAEVQRVAGTAGMQHDSAAKQDKGKHDELALVLEKQDKQVRDTLTTEQQQVWDRNAEQLKAGMRDY